MKTAAPTTSRPLFVIEEPFLDKPNGRWVYLLRVDEAAGPVVNWYAQFVQRLDVELSKVEVLKPYSKPCGRHSFRPMVILTVGAAIQDEIEDFNFLEFFNGVAQTTILPPPPIQVKVSSSQANGQPAVEVLHTGRLHDAYVFQGLDLGSASITYSATHRKVTITVPNALYEVSDELIEEVQRLLRANAVPEETSPSTRSDMSTELIHKVVGQAALVGFTATEKWPEKPHY